MRYFIGILISFCSVLLLPAQDYSAYAKVYFRHQEKELPYRLLSPPDNVENKYPLVIFLHGGFEKGLDNEAQLSIGGKFFLQDSIRKKYPAYVLFPQCPQDDAWAYFENQIDFSTGLAKDWVFPFHKSPTNQSGMLMKLLDSILISGKIDVARIYIAGLSQGAMGVLDLIARYPYLFAAGIAMCGAGDPMTSKLFAGKTALWLFHGEDDKVVPVEFSQQYYRRLSKEHAIVRYTEYKEVAHNCWAKALAEPDLMHWLFSQKKR